MALDRNKKFDAFIYAVLLALCAGAYSLTVAGTVAGSTARNKADIVGAWGYPQILIGLTAALAIAGIVRIVLSRDEAKIEMVSTKELWTLLQFIAVAVAYFCVIDRIGYCVSTAVYAMFSMWWMGVRRPGSIVITGVALTAVLYAAFALFLNADLPAGMLI